MCCPLVHKFNENEDCVNAGRGGDCSNGYAVGDMMVENEDVGMVSGEVVGMVSGRDGGGIGNG